MFSLLNQLSFIDCKENSCIFSIKKPERENVNENEGLHFLNYSNLTHLMLRKKMYMNTGPQDYK